MYYTVYRITNILNGKIYIGAHRTSDLNDGYMGSGKLIQIAIRKHGIENFVKEYLHIFDNPEDMFEMESVLVNEDFVYNAQTYNMAPGGQGGLGGLNEFQSMQEANRLRLASEYADYEANPTFCTHCTEPLPYRKRSNKFCGKSCAATVNNTKRKKPKSPKAPTAREQYDTEPKHCIECSRPIAFEKRNADCCSRSCAATRRNRGRVVTDDTKRKISEKIKQHHDQQ